MNMFSYYITTHFIHSNKDYNSYCNPYSVYQTYPKCACETMKNECTVISHLNLIRGKKIII